MERKLVTIRKIDALDPIPGADAIEVATIEGWKVVVKKGEFTVGSTCCYFEIDSFLPETDSRFSFLMKSGVRTFEGARGHKLKTIRLRKQLSQGLALPLHQFPELLQNVPEDQDYAELLGIKKYEAPIHSSIAGQVRGNFPSYIRKTDQPRAQNLKRDIFEENANSKYEVSVKLDGTSCTYYFHDGEIGVCSRNLDLKLNEDNKDNTLIKLFYQSGLDVALKIWGKNVAIQGEMIGPSIQGNREGLTAPKFFCFDIQDIDTQEHFTPYRRHEALKYLYSINVDLGDINHVPVLHEAVTLAELNVFNMDDLLKYADGPSLKNSVREGLVFKRSDGQFSFKVISNNFLLAEKD